MVDVTIHENLVSFRVEGLHQLWIVVSLAHERHKKLIVEVADPRATTAALRHAIDGTKA